MASTLATFIAELRRRRVFRAAVLILLTSGLMAQEIIDVGVRGISDAQRDGAQKDRLEAILDAKRQACERAGIKIESKTTVENFQAVYDYVEAQAEAVLLPGFQIIDNGYGEDGTYSVVLVGRVKTVLPLAEAETATFHIMIWLVPSPDGLQQRYQFLDRLYGWLQMAHGVFLLDGENLESLEDHLVEVSRSGTRQYGHAVYAYKYQLPAGTIQYIKSTLNRDGSLTEGTRQRIRLRPGLSYVMEVAGWNAIYFNNPKPLEGSVSNARLYGVYPEDFVPVYPQP